MKNFFIKLLSGIFILLVAQSESWGTCAGTTIATWNTSLTAYSSGQQSVKGTTGLSDNYKVNATQNGQLAITISNTDNADNLTVYLYGDGSCGGSALQSITVNHGQSGTLTYTSLVAGQSYSIWITGSSTSSDTTYSLTMSLKGGRNFALRKDIKLYGDVGVIGNTVLCEKNAAGQCIEPTGTAPNPPLVYNNYTDLQYAPESYSTLTLPTDVNGTRVKWARLYWQGRLKGSTTLSDWDTTSKETVSTISMRTPATGTTYVKAADKNASIDLDYTTSGTNPGTTYIKTYSASVDVTSLVKTGGSGKYYIQDLYTYTGKSATDTPSDGLGAYGAWTLVVVYEIPGSKQLKDIAVFDGYKQVVDLDNDDQEDANEIVEVPVSGFYTPKAGSVSSKLYAFTAEGDKNIVGDKFSMKGKDHNSASYTYLGTFDSRISVNAVRSPNLTNNSGIDIHYYDVGTTTGGLGIITNSETGATMKFSTTGDTYFPSLMVFSTDLYTPDVCYIERIFDATNTDISGAGAKVNADDNLTVKVFVVNRDNEQAEKVQIIHTFDTLFPYVTDSSTVNNSNPADIYATTVTAYDGNATLTQQDLLYYDSATNIYKMNLGVGASVYDGGNFLDNNKTTALFTYKGQVKSLDSNYTIEYKAAYVNTSLGLDFSENPITIYTCDGSANSFWGYYLPSTPGKVDVIDPDAWAIYTTEPVIKTKIANQPNTQLKVVNIDPDTLAPKNFTETLGGYPLEVFLYRSDETCTDELPLAEPVTGSLIGEPVLAHIAIGSSNADTNAFVLKAIASKDARIKAKFADWSLLLQGLTSASSCFTSSSLDGNFNGLPQCLNSLGSQSGISQDFMNKYPSIQTMCLAGTSTTSACGSSAYDDSGSKGSIVPEKYNHAYGCLACILDAIPNTSSCSTDNFAIRPDRFAMGLNSPTPISPKLLKSGEDQNVTVLAYQYGTPDTNTLDYNQSSANLTVIIAKRMPDPSNDINGSLHGDGNISHAFTFLNGQSDSNATITFNDVGKITFDLYDTNWAAIDISDYGINAVDYTIQGEGNFTFIPYAFTLDNIHIIDSRNGNFTYVSNDLNMSAKLDLDINARNKQNLLTQNFSAGLYENPISVTPTVIDSVRGDANETAIVSSLIGFTSGLKHIAWDDTNTSRLLRFNFPRDPAVPINPFDVNSSEVNVSVNSIYTDTTMGLGATIENNSTNKVGLTNGTDGNATMLYGRAEGLDYRFSQNPACGRIWYEFYDTNAIDPLITPIFGTPLVLSESSDSNWYKNPQHSVVLDGNVSSITPIPVVTPSVITLDLSTNPAACAAVGTGFGSQKIGVSYNGNNGYPYRTSASLDASDWLDITNNNFGIEFYHSGSWIGTQNKSKTATDPNAETISNRRIMW